MGNGRYGVDECKVVADYSVKNGNGTEVFNSDTRDQGYDWETVGQDFMCGTICSYGACTLRS